MMGGDSYFYSKPGGNGGNSEAADYSYLQKSTKKGGNGHNSLSQILSENIGKIPRIYPRENLELAREMRKAGESTKKYNDLKEQLVTGNLRLVIYIVRKFSKNPNNFLELFSEGAEGLMIAAERYAPDKNASFGTYAGYWITQRILRFLKDDRTIKIPFYFLEKYYKIKLAKRELKQEGNDMFTENIARITGYAAKTVDYVLRIMPNCRSLDYAVDNEYSIKDIVEDKTVTAPFGVVSENEAKKTIDSLLMSTLSFNSREIIKLRFGLDNYEQMTLEEVGQIFNLTRERVRQIEKESIVKLQNKKNIKALNALVGN